MPETSGSNHHSAVPSELQPVSIERMVRAVEKVRQRLGRACNALEKANISYAVVGGNAVAAWVSRVDESAVRNTQDVDILINRSDLESVKRALEGVGFVYRHVKSIDLFLDGENAKARDAIHIVYAEEKVKDEYLCATPAVQQADASGPFRVIDLGSLIQMKLTSYRDKDRTHLRDLIDVGLVDRSWVDRLEPELAGGSRN